MRVYDPKFDPPAGAPCTTNIPQSSERARECDADGLRPLAYGISDAAKVSGLSRSKLYELIKGGTLRSVKVAGRRLVTRAALLELLSAGGE